MLVWGKFVIEQLKNPKIKQERNPKQTGCFCVCVCAGVCVKGCGVRTGEV